MPFAPTAHQGVLHHYTSSLSAFEHAPPSPSSPPPQQSHHDNQTQPQNYILFLGGLGDTPLSVRYPSRLSTLLPPRWRLAEISLTSSGSGWTTGSLTRDCAELARCVAYFRTLQHHTPGARVVLLGHSTGCQVAAAYCLGKRGAGNVPWEGEGETNPVVDGVVLQAGLSDGEAIREAMEPGALARCVALAREWVAGGRGGDVLPASAGAAAVFGASCSAERWVSLASVDGQGEDDWFSTGAGDEAEERTWGARGFGAWGRPVMVVWGGEDEYVPAGVDRAATVARWCERVKRAGGRVGEGSGVVEGLGHNGNRSGKEAVGELCTRIARFVERVERGWDARGLEEGGKL